MRVPQVSERIKEAPAHALRGVFAGIGQLLLITDKLRNKASHQDVPQARTPVAPETVTDTTVTSPTGRDAETAPVAAAPAAAAPAEAAAAPAEAVTAEPVPAKPAARPKAKCLLNICISFNFDHPLPLVSVNQRRSLGFISTPSKGKVEPSRRSSTLLPNSQT